MTWNPLSWIGRAKVFQLPSLTKKDFYTNLYGAKDQFVKDKKQTYKLPAKFQKQLSIKDNKKSVSKQIIRVFGRISACGPFKAGWSHCYADQFDQEFQALLGEL